MTLGEAAGYALQGSEGRAIWFMGGLLTWKAVSNDTGGRFELVEQLCPRGFAAPFHVHEREAEGFYVLEGEVTFVIGSRTLRASPGSFAFVPGNVKHAFRVNSPVAKFLTLITPSGVESFFEELSEPAKARTLPSAHVKPASM